MLSEVRIFIGCQRIYTARQQIRKDGNEAAGPIVVCVLSRVIPVTASGKLFSCNSQRMGNYPPSVQALN
jgi:hypothetical protein